MANRSLLARLMLLVAAGLALGSCAPRAGRAPAGQQVPAPAADSEAFFPIMSWETPPRTGALGDPEHGLASLANCGYTVAAFVRPEDLPACRRLGLCAMLRLDPVQQSWKGMADEQITDRVRQLVRDTARDPLVLGYFLKDEPDVSEFPALGKAMDAVKRLAPGKLAYVNLYPDYATLGAPDRSQLGTASYHEYLEQFVGEVRPQLISYDNYRVQYSMDLKNAATAESYYANLLEVRRVALEHGLPFWNIVSSNQIRPNTPPPSPANLLFQAYTTLAAGGKGLTWYTYYSGGYKYSAVDDQGRRTATWSYLRMVNGQVGVLGPVMTPLRSTGVYFTAPAPAKSLPTLPGELIEAVTAETAVMVGEFTGNGGERYAMLVNLSLERSARVRVKLRGAAGGFVQISPMDATLLPPEADGSVWLAAGAGALLKLR